MFGIRRRRRGARAIVDSEASSPSSPASQWSDDALFDAIRSTLDDFIGPHGSWELVRREEDAVIDDSIFATMSTFSLARSITGVVLSGRSNLSAPSEAPSADEHASNAAAVTSESSAEEPPEADDEQSSHELPEDEETKPNSEQLVDRRLIRPVPREDGEQQVDVELAPIARWTAGEEASNPGQAETAAAPKPAKNSL